TTEIQAAVAEKGEATRRGRGGRERQESLPTRIVIQYPTPSVDDGRYAAKRCVGDTVRVEADVFRDGHELLCAVVRYRGPGGGRWRTRARPMIASSSSTLCSPSAMPRLRSRPSTMSY